MEEVIRLKRPHINQVKIFSEAKRFNHVKCGRRFGKSEMTYDLAAKPALNGKIVAYFAPTYKDSFEWWGHIKKILGPAIESKDEQVKQIKLFTGGIIDVWSMEDPDSGRGRKYHRAIIDECEKARKFKEAWQQTIRATLADYKGDAWFLSTPKFGRTYFKELAGNEQKFNNWKSWKFTSYDNPHIDPSEIDEARDQLEDLVFQCEFLAEDVDQVLLRFANKFSKQKHVVHSLEYNQDHELYIAFDFNVEPCTAVISQYINGEIRFIDEIRIMNSDINEVCDEILVRYPNAVYMVTADASGENRTSLKKNLNHFIIIKRKLRLSESQFKVPRSNPSVNLTRILLNSLLQNFVVLFSEEKCRFTIDDMMYVEVKEAKNGIEIDKDKDKHRGHLIDCVRYTVHAFHRHLIRYLSEEAPEESEEEYNYEQ